MRILYAAFVLSLLALIWAVVALLRHVRRHNERHKTETQDEITATLE